MGVNKGTPRTAENTLAILKYGTRAYLGYIKPVPYLCALGTTFEMIMKQFSSTILKKKTKHTHVSSSVLYAEENMANNFALKTR